MILGMVEGNLRQNSGIILPTGDYLVIENQATRWKMIEREFGPAILPYIDNEI